MLLLNWEHLTSNHVIFMYKFVFVFFRRKKKWFSWLRIDTTHSLMDICAVLHLLFVRSLIDCWDTHNVCLFSLSKHGATVHLNKKRTNNALINSLKISTPTIVSVFNLVCNVGFIQRNCPKSILFLFYDMTAFSTTW